MFLKIKETIKVGQYILMIDAIGQSNRPIFVTVSYPNKMLISKITNFSHEKGMHALEKCMIK